MASPTQQTVSPTDSDGTSRLKGKLGVMSIVFMVVAAAAPLTIFVSTPLNMLTSNGAGIALSYLVAPTLLLIFAAGFAAMTTYIPKAGGFYSYVTAAFGRRIGTGAGFVAMLGYFIGQNFVYALMGQSIGAAIDQFSGGAAAFNLPWWGWAFIIWVAAGIVGYLNIDFSARVLSVVLILEVLIIVVINLFILGKGGGPEGISLTSIFGADVIFSGPIGLSLLLGLSVGLGFEATAVFRDEAREPEKTIPRAIYVTLISAAIFYGTAVWAFVQAFGVHGLMDAVAADPFGIVYAVAADWVHPIFSDIVLIVAITSMFACVLAYHNIAARYLHSLGHSVLPARLASVHPKHKSPHVASVVTSLVGLVLLIIWTFSGVSPDLFVAWEIAVATLSIITVLVLTSVAILVFFRRNPQLDRRPWQTMIAPALAFLVLGGILLVALLNFGALTASEAPGLNFTLMALPFVAIIAGVIIASIAKKRDPERYEGHHTSLMETVSASRESIDSE
ncbi:MAG: APC family permease [Gulosibacter sp.]|uniref:APC family permease n=1 Tax=Gulosibacter sp. TaxID=2817531 RepID=UPI003F92A51B